MGTLTFNNNAMKPILMTTVFFMLAVTSCAAPRKMISKSTIKLEGKNTNIRDLIEIDGYYQATTIDGKRTGMIFFEDGSCCSFVFKEDVTEDMKRRNLSQMIESWEQKGQIRWGFYWGVYKIDKDTIVSQTVERYGIFSMPWSFDELKYEVIDNRTLKLIYQKSLYPADIHDMKKDHYEISEKNIIDTFVPANSLPSSDNWLKEEKWIWRFEQDWKEYLWKIKLKR